MTQDYFAPWGGELKAERELQPSIRQWFARTRAATAAERIVAIRGLVRETWVQRVERPRMTFDIITRKLHQMTRRDRSGRVRSVVGEVAAEWIEMAKALNELLREPREA